MLRRLAPLVLALSLTTACAGPTASINDQGGGKPARADVRASKGSALEALRKLPVKGRAPMTNYDRDQFGSEWDDAVGDWAWSRNGCDTRNDVLARDLTNVTYNDGDCDVAAGILPYDVYSGQREYVFDSNDDEYATDLDIEHVVALGNAWATGAQQLSPGRRAELANDPLNLMAVNPSLNRQKGDGDFATWLPPNSAFRCSYAARQIRVKTLYDLWVTAPEKAAMERVLSSCPDEPLAQPDPIPWSQGKKVTEGDGAKAQPSPTPTSKPGGPKAGSSKTDRRFDTCTALHEAGFAGNYVRGQDREYRWYEDRDNDGRVCES